MSEVPASNIEKTIYVRLIDELVEVWRPVAAFDLGDMYFELAPAEIDREVETWEFWPGDVVRVELKQRSGDLLPIAVAKTSRIVADKRV